MKSDTEQDIALENLAIELPLGAEDVTRHSYDRIIAFTSASVNVVLGLHAILEPNHRNVFLAGVVSASTIVALTVWVIGNQLRQINSVTK